MGRIVTMFILVCICTTTALPANNARINVFVDPRMELLAAVQLLSGYGEKYPDLITRFDFPYKSDMAAYFARYKDHRAVKLFAQMSDRFSYDAPPAVMLYLSDPPELILRLPFSDYVNARASGEKQLKELVEALRDFARESSFQAFYDGHKGTYQAIVEAIGKEMEGSDWIMTLEQYHGQAQASYTIIPSPLFVHGGFGSKVKLSDGKFETYNVCGPTGVKDGFPVFGSRESIKHLAWHEFGHSFVNPPWEKYQKELAKYSSLHDPIASKMQKQAYGNWSVCVNEHIVRAVEVRLTYEADGKRAADKVLRAQKKKGFAYIEALCRKLEEYEKQRDKYPTLESFYPEIVAVFKSLSEQKLAPEFYATLFRGPINAVSADKESVVLIVPTHENNTAVQNQIDAYVNRMRDRFHKNSPVLTDDEALKQDLSTKAILVYGTMSGNAWLTRYATELPAQIAPRQIVADSTYSGTGLRFITAWPNPQNRWKGVLIYTAQRAEDIPGINGVIHGLTDYVVARDKEVLKAADYVKNGRWTFE